MPMLSSASEATGGLARYRNEWNALRILTWDHDPVIPTLFDVGCDSVWQNNYDARELVDGSTLERLVANRLINFQDAIRILSVIAGAVQRMHELKIAHCNLRPSSILVQIDGLPKLIGFGHVWPLAGADRLAPGMSGVSPEIELRALQGILAWIIFRFHQDVPAWFNSSQLLRSMPTAGRFAATLDSYLQER
jgi:serine/threonine protein kinase